ncbi:MAG: TonB-dependent receptor [Pseudomonadota bacterium]
MKTSRWLTAGILGLAVSGSGGAALASGYALREQSALGQGSSFAGVPARGDDPSMLFFNPASMAWLPGIQTSIVGSLVIPRADLSGGSARRATALGGSTITGSASGDAASDALIPAFYTSIALGTDWHVGLAITSPFGLVTKYDSDFIGRYHGLTSELRTINITPSVAWRPIETLSIGAGLQIQHADARISNAVDFGAILAGRGARVTPGSLDGRATLSGDDLAFGWQVGAQWRPAPGTALGFAFRSAIHHELEGDTRFENVPAPLATTFRDGGGRVKLTTPESASLGLTQALTPDLTLLATAEWTNWSRFRTLIATFDTGLPPTVTDERWRDTVFLALGAEYRVSQSVTLRTGVAWDQTPVRTEYRTPRIPDSNRYWLSAGLTWQVLPNVAFSAGYTHIFGNTADLALASGGPTSNNFTRGDLSARYSASVDIVTAQLRIGF